jgi:hypothetical protein
MGRGLICMDCARPPIQTGRETARAPFGGGLTAPGAYRRWVLRPAGVGRRRALPGGFGPARGRCQSWAAVSGARAACWAGCGVSGARARWRDGAGEPRQRQVPAPWLQGWGGRAGAAPLEPDSLLSRSRRGWSLPRPLTRLASSGAARRGERGPGSPEVRSGRPGHPQGGAQRAAAGAARAPWAGEAKARRSAAVAPARPHSAFVSRPGDRSRCGSGRRPHPRHSPEAQRE